MARREDILVFASLIRNAQIIHIHSGGREPGGRVSSQGKGWIVAGLKLLANRRAIRKKKKK